VLQNVLKHTLGDKYDDDSKKAWNYVWTRCARKRRARMGERGGEGA
jgi:hypothetical protein